MTKPLDQFKPLRRRSLRAQITDSVREMVLSGELPAGSKLPSTQELAGKWDAPAPTVQKALEPLVKEGLLERTPRVGTFVRRRDSARLTRVGVYLPAEVWHDPSDHFRRAVSHELHRQLAAEGVEQSVWVDPRPDAERKACPWDELVRAASERRFQVLLAPGVPAEYIAWLEKLAVPTVYMSTATITKRVTTDTRGWAAMALHLLSEQGCRRVGVIATPGPLRPERKEPCEASILSMAVQKGAAELGIEVRPEWIRLPQREFTNNAVQLPEFGFEQMQSLWRLPERPDGVAVFDDVTASGVLMAVMNQSIEVPRDLKLALHRNAEVGMFCPFPAAFLDMRVADVAAALIEQARKLYAGREVAPVYIKPHPVSAPTAAKPLRQSLNGVEERDK